MDTAVTWFNGLPSVAHWSLVLLLLPLALSLLGALMLNDNAGDFWGKDDPTIADYFRGSLVVGTVGAVLLSFIFGCTLLLRSLIGLVAGDSWWSYLVSFIVSLLLVLCGVYAWGVRATHKKVNVFDDIGTPFEPADPDTHVKN